MSICIAIAVPDGIALAADSQTTWNQTITQVKEAGTGRIVSLEKPIQQPISWSKMARKLFDIKIQDSIFGVCVAGTAILNHKTIYSLFKSLEASYEGENNYDAIVKYFVHGVQKQMQVQLGTEELKNATQRLSVDFIIAGYENKDVSKPRIESHMVFSGKIMIDNNLNDSGHIVRWRNTKGSARFGGCWIGRTEFISHLVNQKSNLPPIQGQYELLSLADAVDYTRFLVDFTCDYQRFAIMVPDCGKPIISAKLTPSSYSEEII
ncbi:MAG: hypothetical protein EA412_04420 [Chitinophagaceae bacterium]|nr:MAG: hypothetical protein EA412_04420 [Chitinophagaceae bacterium]